MQVSVKRYTALRVPMHARLSGRSAARLTAPVCFRESEQVRAQWHIAPPVIGVPLLPRAPRFILCGLRVLVL